MSPRIILVLEPFDEDFTAELNALVKDSFCVKRAGYDDDELLKEELHNAEVVIGQPPLCMLTEPENNCPKLRFIQMTWAGTDIYTGTSQEAALSFPKERILLANASGAFGMIMSQFVVGMILSLMLGFKEYAHNQDRALWKKGGAIKSLDNASVLIYGAGDIGTCIAKRLSGFNAHCIGVCRDTEKRREYFEETCTLVDSDKYLSEADVVIGCIPANGETSGFMDEARLRRMKEGAVLINVGRGNFIDCMALDKVLGEGHLTGAGLDVTDPEPLPASHPLWKNPRCMITPHTSGASFGQLKETERLIGDIVLDNISAYIAGGEIKNKVF